MKVSRCFLPLVLFSLLTAGHSLAADSVADVVAKARASVGSETVLNSLKSIHYVGTLETVEATPEGPKTNKFKVELIYQKPFRSRIIITTEKKIEITALDDYEAWQRQQDPKDKDNWVVTLMPPAQVKSLRANTWESLAFFGGAENADIQVEDRGVVDVDGVKCRKLAFIHDEGIFFIHYFSTDTGRLMLTETDQGAKVHETGEIKTGGLRLAKQYITTNLLSDGKNRVVTMTFDQITLNENFAPDLFQVPTVQLK